MLADIKKAKEFIFLEFFIIDEGIFWNSILDLLVEKVNFGLEVKVVYDDIGCMGTLPGSYYKKLSKLPVETISKYQTGYFENIIEKISELVKKILQAEYLSIIITFIFLFYTLYNQSVLLFIGSFITSLVCILLSVKILKKANVQVDRLYDQEYEYFYYV